MTERAELRAAYGEVYDQIAALLFEADPARINFEMNIDEYEPEVDTILPRLRTAASVDDVHRILREEFAHWFEGAGAMNFDYHGVAAQIWAVWQSSQLPNSRTEP